MPRQLHINLFIYGRGHHEAAWRHPLATRASLTDIDYYRALARRAEAGRLDSIFFADQLSLSASEVAHTPKGGLEPITTLAAVAGATEHIGLVATASTTYTEPFNLARQFASVDHISGGRAGWNIVTSWSEAAAANFGRTEPVSHGQRYELAEEYIQAVKALWDSWGSGALVDDPASGIYLDATRIRPANFQGRYYQVAGPLNIAQSPQGRPVLVQAGSSVPGRRFASRHAEAIFTAQPDLPSAQAFYSEIKQLVRENGRAPDQVVVLPGINPTIGATEADARRLWQELGDLTDIEVGLERLSQRFGGVDFHHLPLDRPLSVDDFPDPDTVQASRSRTEVYVRYVRQHHPTLRELLRFLAGGRGHFSPVGTPEQIADVIEHWFRSGAADGFNLMPQLLPAQLDIFVDEVLPLLRQRGVFRTEYEGRTLREHYGLAPLD